jgi:hypothetical protein
MRSVVLSMIISLDGFIAGPERELDWMIGPDPEREAEHLQFLEHVDTMLIGHGVYHDMVGYWPTATSQLAGDPARSTSGTDANVREARTSGKAGLDAMTPGGPAPRHEQERDACYGLASDRFAEVPADIAAVPEPDDLHRRLVPRLTPVLGRESGSLAHGPATDPSGKQSRLYKLLLPTIQRARRGWLAFFPRLRRFGPDSRRANPPAL